MDILVSSFDKALQGMFIDHGHKITYMPRKADVICFSGGADITPLLYGQKKMRNTTCYFPRDAYEIAMWKEVDPMVPKVGICRGAQLGNVLCGGSMWQDVDNHKRTHQIRMENTGELIEVTSIHHQMCILTKEAILEASAAKATRKENETRLVTFSEASGNDWTDPEAFYYANFNFLGVQFHPEYGHKPSEKYFFDLFDQYVNQKMKHVTPGLGPKQEVEVH